MPRKPWTDLSLTKFWGLLKYIDQISMHFPIILLAVLGILTLVTFGS